MQIILSLPEGISNDQCEMSEDIFSQVIENLDS